MLVYNGDRDYMANWMGAKAWTEALSWRFQQEFIEEDFKDWRVKSGSKVAGQFKSFGNLTLFRIFEAGKMVPRDQPEVALKMLLEFMKLGTLDQK